VARNVEVKARLSGLADARRAAEKVGARFEWIDEQVDRYYQVGDESRVKLRTCGRAPAELIRYARPETSGVRASEYEVLPVRDAEAHACLVPKTPPVVVVRKTRELWLLDNVRIHLDTVDGLGTLTRNPDGTAAIGGVAWAQTRGISNVEVQIGDGEWAPADLGDALNADTWRQWAFRWTPAGAGRTTIRCRATDGNGVIQTDERSEPLPDGASGHHQIVVFVE